MKIKKNENNEWSDYEDDSDDEGAWFKRGYDDADSYKDLEDLDEEDQVD